jgi:hypothetical protein
LVYCANKYLAALLNSQRIEKGLLESGGTIALSILTAGSLTSNLGHKLPIPRLQNLQLHMFNASVVTGQSVCSWQKKKRICFQNALGYSWRCTFLQRCNSRSSDWLLAANCVTCRKIDIKAVTLKNV